MHLVKARQHAVGDLAFAHDHPVGTIFVEVEGLGMALAERR